MKITYDLTFIGSGMACVTTLISTFTDLLQADILPTQAIKIAVIEKQAQLWTGLPYGEKSSVNCLTITPLVEFLTDSGELEEFVAWLLKNADWVTEYQKLGGSIAQNWYNRNKHLINNDHLHTIPVPRYIYGKFKTAQLTGLLNRVQLKGLVNLTTIRAEAIAIDQTAGAGYKVSLHDRDGKKAVLSTHKLVIATGSLPHRKLGLLQQVPAERLINTAYEPAVDHALIKIQRLLASVNDTAKRNLLLVGSSASTLEFLYMLCYHNNLNDLINKIIVLSPSGKLPLPTVRQEIDIVFPYLEQLAGVKNIKPEVVAEALLQEFKTQFLEDVSVVKVAKLLSRTRQLLPHLSQPEYTCFLMQYEHIFSKQIRRAGKDYLSGATQLKLSNKLELLPGYLTNLLTDDVSGPITLHYHDSNKEEKAHPLKFQAVISCSGFETFQECTNPLISDALNKNLCQINQSGKGINVNNHFEASPNLYVMGPLLAGNINDNLRYWHLESVARLSELAPVLSKFLLADIMEQHHVAH